MNQLLIIDDEENMRHMLLQLLSKKGYHVETACDGVEGLEKVGQRHFDFILCDIKMPNMGGMSFLEKAQRKLENTTVIMMSAYGSIDLAIDAMKLGAYDYISKPFKADEVFLVLKKAEERERLKSENRNLKKRIENIEEQYRFGNMVAKSESMRKVFRLAEKVAMYNTTVLITGESGTGKELIARGIHFCGPRSKFPLVPVNCGGIPENLLESELFGYRKGAFTGADRNKKGLFQEAHGGTLFLDEIGELPPALQVKILRILQENEVRPIGEARATKIDVRVIAATSRNLKDAVEKGEFRQDLFYRLNVLPIRLPTLSERMEDVPMLSEHFIQKFNRRLNKNVKGLLPAAMNRLLQHPWPGNVRELENAIERAIVLSESDVLKPESFSLEGIPGIDSGTSVGVAENYSLKAAKQKMEKELITRALEKTGGNRTRAAKLLEISHPSLLSKIRSYQIVS